MDACPAAALVPSFDAPARPGTADPATLTRPQAASRAFTETQFRDALAQFATGVTVICARHGDGRYVGFTANSFNSVSLEPPLILWSLSRRSVSLPAFEDSERYVVNVLSADQVEVARRFSRPHADRFEGVAYSLGWAGAPLIDGCAAWFECSHHAKHRAGDHVVFIGDVRACARAHGRGLVFHEHRYATTDPLDRA
jgi:flavin reductase (DIM6/NTAB) family NADH-FMN oxidoreductase RutF